MRIFVAGATGVVGRSVVLLLLAGGHDATATGRTAETRNALRRLGRRAPTWTCSVPTGFAAPWPGMVIQTSNRAAPALSAVVPSRHDRTCRLRR